ncbi:MAG: TetR/AcrR family transcriptional regulator [Chitinophagaceae bacterium]
MSISDRRAKEKEELRALILDAARTQFLEKGIEQTTIRSIADAIEYSVGTVYKYYRDKNAILHALHSKGFHELGGQFAVLFHVADPMERLKSMGRLYIRFAMEQPDMYDLMFNLKAPMEFLETIHKNEWDEGKLTFDMLRNTVRECIKAGHFSGHALEPLSFLIWSCVHGMCMLEIRGRTKGVNMKKPEEIVVEGYEAFVKLIEES